MKTVITYGTFDLFHIGHLNLLKRLNKLGDRLVVGVSTDEFNMQKNKKTIIPYSERAEIVLSIKCVDSVFPETCWEQKREDILRENASIFAMGDDWAGKFDNLSDCVEVVYIPRTPNISTTDLKQVMSIYGRDKIDAILHSLSHVESLVRNL